MFVDDIEPKKLGDKVNVLDGGFVRLVNISDTDCDAAIVQSARVSYGAGTKTKREDAGLINYLMKNDHTSPFEMPVFRFHCKMPIFIARQWVRHRTASLNEYSGRYSEMPNEFYIPDPENVKAQDTVNKQGSSGELSEQTREFFVGMVEGCTKHNREMYEIALNNGVSREMSRIILPLNQYTEWYWQMDLHNLLHFLKLRVDSHAQLEIRAYGRAIASFVKEYAPATWNAFVNHKLQGKTFSGEEIKVLSELIDWNQLQSEEASKKRLRILKSLTDKIHG